ncbi:MAG: hypothetical protein H6600_07395 [Flavobacteriales bacterium]|nr:hypothetical protein [Flavobacteriales bacterium]MCB9198266.1 hypothetical protein [Flavobacteriales bacterium]
MKKVLLSLGIVASFAVTSCGIDVEKAAEDFCACKDMEGDAKSTCHDEWVSKYAKSAGSKEDGEKLAAKMMECDMSGLIEIGPKIEEASK